MGLAKEKTFSSAHLKKYAGVDRLKSCGHGAFEDLAMIVHLVFVRYYSAHRASDLRAVQPR